MNMLVGKMGEIIAWIIVFGGIVIMISGLIKGVKAAKVLKNKKLNQNDLQSLTKSCNDYLASALFGAIAIIIGILSSTVFK